MDRPGCSAEYKKEKDDEFAKAARIMHSRRGSTGAGDDDNNKNANFFLKELDNPYKLILSDKDGTLAIQWGAYGVPETFLIQNKKIIKKIIGPIDKDILSQIKKLIK